MEREGDIMMSASKDGIQESIVNREMRTGGMVTVRSPQESLSLELQATENISLHPMGWGLGRNMFMVHNILLMYDHWRYVLELSFCISQSAQNWE